MNVSTIIAITRREVKSFFDNPTAYIVMVVFLLLWEFLFFRQVFLVEEASLRMLFDMAPWLLLLLVSALTMGSVSQEKNEGTLELVLTHPVKVIDFVLGKFIAILLYVLVSLLAVFPLAFSLSLYGNLDWGVVVAQIIGTLLAAATLTGLGIFVSALVSSAIAALLLTIVSGFFLIVAGYDLVTAALPLSITPLFERLSLSTHFAGISRGVIDIADVWYFVSATLVFLALAYLQLIVRKYGNRKKQFRSYQRGMYLFIAVALLTNVIGNRIPGRIDLTQNKQYSLSPATVSTLAQLGDVVTITLYASESLPSQLIPVARDTKDMLTDYAARGSGKIIVRTKNPSQDPEIAQEATLNGVQEVQFNVLSQEEFQVKTGFLGLTVTYENDHEAIPFIQQTNDLEYQLTSFIKKLTTPEKKSVAFLSGHGEKQLEQFQLVSEQLDKQFSVETVTIEETTTEIASQSAVLVIAGPTEPLAENSLALLKSYLESGKSIVFLVDTHQVDPQSLAVSATSQNVAEFVKNYGVEVKSDVVYDLRASETLRFGSNGMSYLLPYPPWIRALPTQDATKYTGLIESVVFPWTSSLSIDDQVLATANRTKIELLATSDFAATQPFTAPLTPETEWNQTGLGRQLVGVALEPNEDQKQGSIVVFGNSDFLTDQFVQTVPENGALFMSVLSLLSREESLASLQIKNQQSHKLLFSNKNQPTTLKAINMGLVVLVPVLYGATRLMRRNKLKQKSYANV